MFLRIAVRKGRSDSDRPYVPASGVEWWLAVMGYCRRMRMMVSMSSKATRLLDFLVKYCAQLISLRIDKNRDVLCEEESTYWELVL